MNVFDERVFLETLSEYHAPLVANPWRTDEETELDIVGAAALRREWLAAYLATRRGASVLLVAEAAGYQGCRFSGVPLTCERMLLGRHARVGAAEIFPAGAPASLGRTSAVTATMPAARREGGYNEPTDTVVWGAALDAGLAPEDFVLWNIFPFHPHKKNQPLSNRTPTESELAAGLTYVRALLAQGRFALTLAIGRKSAGVLAAAGVEAIPLRHPANGGVPEFRRGFAAALAEFKS